MTLASVPIAFDIRKLNKRGGAELSISDIIVKAHRGQVMRKTSAESLASLVNMAARLGLATVPIG
jgi:FixJ family two-component response regulator